MADATTPRPPSPRSWPLRFAALVAVAAAVAFAVYAFGRAGGGDATPAPATDPAIVEQVPPPGSHVPRQSQVGAILRPGYDGRLTIDGTPIPEAQLDGAIPTTAERYDPQLGVRPNTKNRVLYTPAEGKAVTSLGSGQVLITVRFWPLARGPGAAKTVSWAVSVT